MRVRLPNGWNPRPYQLPAWTALEQGRKRGVLVWHRRAGKDDIALHWSACQLHQRIGNYWHMLPEASQARKAIWEAINPHTGKLRIDEAFPQALRETTRSNEMFIKFKCGSSWQVVGSDNYNSLVGTPPVGVVFSEYALADPQAWAYLRPILAENGGWALFIYTPRGRNHGLTLYEAARDDPNWYAEILTAEQTGVFSPETLAAEKRELAREHGDAAGGAMFQQEYFCSFNAPMLGAYYAEEMDRAERDKRITRVPWEPASPVHTAWDLGIGDSTAIWFVQRVGREWRWIDYLENHGVGLDWYARELKAKPYVYGEHVLPHDANVKELTSGITRTEFLSRHAIRGRVLANQRLEDGVQALRNVLSQSWFDAENCARGIECLRQYRREYDEVRKVFSNKPLHDWTSHGADAARYMALGSPVSQSQEEALAIAELPELNRWVV